MDETSFDLFASEDEAEPDTWEPVPNLEVDGAQIELRPGAVAVWASSLYLSRFLAANAALVKGKRVIELGAGIGLPSLVSAKLGAAHVLVTDVDKYAVEALPVAIAKNGVTANAEAAKLDWFAYLRPGPAPSSALAPVPLLIAADCNYTTAAVPALIAVIDALLEPSGGELLLASREQRIGLSDCLARLQAPISEGGLNLTLETFVTFSEDGDSWKSSTASEIAQIRSKPTKSADVSDPMASAEHRLWIFRRRMPQRPAEAESSPFDVSSLYFERQVLMRCGRHALNNMLGRAAFSSAELDEIAVSLAGNLTLVHRWPVLGNYDINVILLALQKRGLEGAFWDRRRSETELRDTLAAPAVVGALLNVKSRPRLLGGIMPVGRHWVALRALRRAAASGQSTLAWADVDSDLASPVLLDSEAAVMDRVRSAFADDDGHLIIVRAYFPHTVR